MEWSADLNSEDFCRSPLTHSVLQSISLFAAGVICDMILLFTREMTEPVRAPCMAFFYAHVKTHVTVPTRERVRVDVSYLRHLFDVFIEEMCT